MRLGYVSPDTAPDGWQRYAGRISFPYINAKGDVIWLKFRSGPETPPEADKYAQEPGGGVHLYNTQALRAPGDLLALVEGEMDTVTGTALGIPTVGIPGVGGWEDYFPRCLQGWGRVVMFYDNDKPGRGLVKLIKKSMPDIIPLAPPGGHHDLNEAFVAGLGPQIVALARGEEQDHGEEEAGDDPGAVRTGNVNGISNPDGDIPY